VLHSNFGCCIGTIEKPATYKICGAVERPEVPICELVENKSEQRKGKPDTNPKRIRSAVGLAAMKNTSNLDSLRSGADEEEPVVADAKPEFFSSLECLYVAFAGIREAIQGGENAHGGGLVQAAESALAGSVQTMRFTSAL